jgi:hypothetical protein
MRVGGMARDRTRTGRWRLGRNESMSPTGVVRKAAECGIGRFSQKPVFLSHFRRTTISA